MVNVHKDKVAKLTNLMLPHLQIVLARQRMDYGIDEEASSTEYPLGEQAADIDATPMHNIGMDRQTVWKGGLRTEEALDLAISQQVYNPAEDPGAEG
jgi:hypothetical protein